MVATRDEKLDDALETVADDCGALRGLTKYAGLSSPLRPGVLPVARLLLDGVRDAVERTLFEWRAFCKAVADRGDASGVGGPAAWQRRAEKAEVGAISALIAVGWLQETADVTPGELDAARRRLAEIQKLSLDASRWRTDDDLIELAVEWFPLDEAEFVRQAKEHPFVPTPAMLAEDWSAPPRVRAG